MVSKKANVVVFDSGIGGLNLLYECALRVRDVDYYYISDSRNMPYGNRGRDEITSLTLNALSVIEKLHPIAVVIACNTVTANCIDVLRMKYPFPIIGVQPAIKSVSSLCDNCLILATNATVKSEEFNNLIARYKGTNCFIEGCDNLAKYVEDNIFNLPDSIPDGLLPDVEPDCVVLGCTHYSFISRQISSHYGCPVIDGIGATADHFAKIIGIIDHSTPLLGKIGHFTSNSVNITFLGQDNEKNSQLFETILKNKHLNTSNSFIKIKKI